ncbi:MAG TPA: hemerythrin family protein [Anaeromyxobacteraceae bacterium]|nr:hemerythrin family protein [Anaeromyxobacteraceae bacterium]
MQETHAWNTRLDVGDEALDREHHLQIALVSALADALEQGRPWVARQVSEQLAGFTAAHFAGEEMLMDAAAYDLRQAHAEEHRALSTAITEIRTLLGNEERDLALAMTLDLRTTLAGHMAASDRRFADHENAQRARRGAS